MFDGIGFGAGLGGHIGSRASELLDGRLTAEDEHRARLHLGNCRQCATMVAAEQEAREALRAVAVPPTLTPPTSLIAGLMSMSATTGQPSPNQPSQPDGPLRGFAGGAIGGQPGLSPTLQTPAPWLSGPEAGEPAGWRPRLRDVVVASTLVASSVTVAVVVSTSATPQPQRQAGLVARGAPTAQLVQQAELTTGPRAYNQAVQATPAAVESAR